MPNAQVLGLNDPRGLIPYIRATAQNYGIDPDIAVRVAQSEGLGNPVGDRGKSFGAFQLYTGGGMGNDFQRATGLDPADPNNERAGIDYALKQASLHGWGPFHGAAKTGIDQWQGITIGNPPIGAPLGAPQMAQGSPFVPGAIPPQPQQNAPQQALQGGGQGDAIGQAAPLNAPTPPLAQLTPLQPFRPQVNLMHLQQAMARFPLLRGFL